MLDMVQGAKVIADPVVTDPLRK